MNKTPFESTIYDHIEVEKRIASKWEENGTYQYANAAGDKIFSVDTPPPYVSAAHLHVGHAMSYSQAEFIVRYKRMKGFKVFYPMGFDDNGLPTERYVEKLHKVNSKKMPRKEFIQLCLNETQAIAKTYETLWRDLGLSIDWTQTYSTISAPARRTAQWSFIDLYEKGIIYQSNAPVIWCPTCSTSLAQADVDTLERNTQLLDIIFLAAETEKLIISTTRPELLPACVALCFHPEDERYQHLSGRKAKVPLFDINVPIIPDESVKTEYGTGLMMVCTFGDAEDVEKWRRHGFEYREVITANGRLNEAAGPFAGLTIGEGRKAIINKLIEEECLVDKRKVKQIVGTHERCTTPIEYQVLPQWFISVVNMKEAFLERGEELRWYPEWMKARYVDWVTGLKWDWNISRQRFYGVPVPVWYCRDNHHVILPPKDKLPVDPLEETPPVQACPDCGCETFIAEKDVMDTWMTSSLTPLINTRWCEEEKRAEIYPLTLRVQAFEIIRTWLFYTVAKSHFHTDSLPWNQVMISGWGLNEQGKKISKRHLEKFEKDGHNRYDPRYVIEKYGADSLRYWAASASLGLDLRYNEKEVKKGRRLLIKLWNASSLVYKLVSEKDPRQSGETMDIADRTIVDKWIISTAQKSMEAATRAFEQYEYSHAVAEIDKLFWHSFCDNYLELIKDRFLTPEEYSDAYRLSGRLTLLEVLRTILATYAPFIPFITEELYGILYSSHEKEKSIHLTAWPDFSDNKIDIPEEGEFLVEVVKEIRRLRTEKRINAMTKVDSIILDVNGDALKEKIDNIWQELKCGSRTQELRYGQAEWSSNIEGLGIEIEHTPSPTDQKKSKS